MDGFGWSTQYAADPCLRSPPGDDGLLSAFMSFHDVLRSDHGSFDLPSSRPIPNQQVHCHDGTNLSDGVPAAFMGLDTADVLPMSVPAGAASDVLFDSFAYVVESPAQATVSNSNTVDFSCYSSSNTGGNGGNISSGESNTYGGHVDIEVASSPCAASAAASKPKLEKHPAVSCASATTTMASAAAEPRRGAKRAAAAATSSSSTSITFGGQSRHHHQVAVAGGGYEPDAEAMAQVKEMIYRAAAMRPVHQLLVHRADDPSSSSRTTNKRRRNVRISSDPQTVAARLRRERVSERLRVLQRLVPGGARMDTASMLDEAASYLRFLKAQLKALDTGGGGSPSSNGGGGIYHCNGNYTGNLGGGSGTVLAFGSRDGIGGYVKSNRNMPL